MLTPEDRKARLMQDARGASPQFLRVMIRTQRNKLSWKISNPEFFNDGASTTSEIHDGLIAIYEERFGELPTYYAPYGEDVHVVPGSTFVNGDWKDVKWMFPTATAVSEAINKSKQIR